MTAAERPTNGKTTAADEFQEGQLRTWSRPAWTKVLLSDVASWIAETEERERQQS